MSKPTGRISLPVAKKVASHVLTMIGGKAMVCGSVRRGVPVVNDIDIVAIKTPELIARLKREGFTIKSTVASARVGNIPVSVYYATPEDWGAMVLHFTGSKAMNVMMRANARRKGMILNQYGLFKGKQRVASRTENQIFDALNMRHVLPIERSKSF